MGPESPNFDPIGLIRQVIQQSVENHFLLRFMHSFQASDHILRPLAVLAAGVAFQPVVPVLDRVACQHDNLIVASNR